MQNIDEDDDNNKTERAIDSALKNFVDNKNNLYKKIYYKLLTFMVNKINCFIRYLWFCRLLASKIH